MNEALLLANFFLGVSFCATTEFYRWLSFATAAWWFVIFLIVVTP